MTRTNPQVYPLEPINLAIILGPSDKEIEEVLSLRTRLRKASANGTIVTTMPEWKRLAQGERDLLTLSHDKSRIRA